MDRKLWIGSLTGFAMAMIFVAMCVFVGRQLRPSDVQKVDTVTVVRVDTHFVDRPVAKDSAVVRYITRVVKVADVSGLEADTSETCLNADTDRQEVSVELPIEQKHYVDSTYEAWVSGYEPALDSIRVFNRTTERTITLTKVKNKRFGVGVQAGAGYGLIHQKPDVYVGIGGYFRLF